METHYDVLRIKRSATAGDVSKAYSLELELCVSGSERARKVSAAYLVLSDEQKRQEYDREIDAALFAAEQDENQGTWFHHSGPQPGQQRRKPSTEKTERAHKTEPSEPRTHYQNLHIDRKASAEVIRAAYKALAQKWHPDKNPDQRERAERYFRIISDAFHVLSDPVRRAEYDARLAARQREQHGATEHDDSYRGQTRGNSTPPPPRSTPRGRGESAENHYPWRRFWARLTDRALFILAGLITVFLFAWTTGINPFFWTNNEIVISIALSIVSFLIFEPIMISQLSTTPGKFLLGIRVKSKTGARLSFAQSISRTLYASLVGAGAYTVIGLFTAAAAKNRLGSVDVST